LYLYIKFKKVKFQEEEMRNSIKKITIVLIFIISVLLNGEMCIVYATDNTSSNENSQNQQNNEDMDNNESDEEVAESHDDEVRSTQESTQTTSPATTVSADTDSTKRINSYSTVSTIPEANLSLNNILNVILIAIGIIMILLAIAILVRLKG